MKKLFHRGVLGTATLLLTISTSSSAWWGNNWDNGWNDWPVWTPMYWAEEMFGDNYGYGPYGYGPYNYGGYSPYSYGYGPYNYGGYPGYGYSYYPGYGYSGYPGYGYGGYPAGWGG